MWYTKWKTTKIPRTHAILSQWMTWDAREKRTHILNANRMHGTVTPPAVESLFNCSIEILQSPDTFHLCNFNKNLWLSFFRLLWQINYEYSQLYIHICTVRTWVWSIEMANSSVPQFDSNFQSKYEKKTDLTAAWIANSVNY